MEMFPKRIEPELEIGVLRSGRRFKSGKRRKIERGRWNPSLFKGSEHELWSCEDEEEDHILILEGPEDLEGSDETSGSEHNYIKPEISLEIISRVSSPKRTSTTDITSSGTSAQVLEFYHSS